MLLALDWKLWTSELVIEIQIISLSQHFGVQDQDYFILKPRSRDGDNRHSNRNTFWKSNGVIGEIIRVQIQRYRSASHHRIPKSPGQIRIPKILFTAQGTSLAGELGCKALTPYPFSAGLCKWNCVKPHPEQLQIICKQILTYENFSVRLRILRKNVGLASELKLLITRVLKVADGK